MEIEVNLDDKVETEKVMSLYVANKWSAANEPNKLLNALRNSHSLVTTRVAG